MVPKVIFKKLSLKENIDLVKSFFFDDTTDLDIYGFTVKLFPLLSGIDKTLSKENINSLIEEIVTKEYEQKIPKIEEEITRYNEIWNQYNDIYFQSIAKFLNIDWPASKKTIYGYIGILPVFPRFLKNFSFALNIDLTSDKLIEVVAHETLHFIWFEKWKQLYPACLETEFESPHLTWKYSEMVTDAILNSSEINKVIKICEKSYASFYELKDGDRYLMDVLKEIYESDNPIEEKIKNGYEYIKSIMNDWK